jgi:hypothetical protein
MLFFKYIPGLYQGADHTGRRVFNMGGGGGGGPTTSTVTQSNIPDWLRPQTEALLGAGTQEYFNTEFNPETGGYDITGTKPYTPYSADPRDYIAQFSPQQQQMFAEAAGMQTPGGFQTGQQMTGTAGMGALDTTGQALGYGAQAAGMGGMYEQMATDPRSMQAYMSPYMQNVVEIQKQAAIEDAQRAQLGANLGAARQGTYGGARQTLAQTQREAGLNKQLSDIQGLGLQSAFDQAQKSQQFGVTTGLQGLQTGLQGVQGAQAGFGLLGRMGEQAANIGTAQQQADLARLGFKAKWVTLSNNNSNRLLTRLSKITHSPKRCQCKDWLATMHFFVVTQRLQQRPNSIRLGQTLLRNLLVLAPWLTEQATKRAALLTRASMRWPCARPRGENKMIGQGLGRVALAERLSISQLEEAIQNRTIPAYIGIPLLEEKTQLEQRMKAAQMGQTPQPQMTIADQVMQQANMAQGGIDEIPVEMEMAGGGIVAFEDGGRVQRFQNQGLVADMTEEELQAQDQGIAPPMPPEPPPAAPPQQMFAPLDPKEILSQTETLYGGLYGRGAGAAAPGDKLSYVSKAEDFFKQAGVDLNLAAKQAADIAAEKEALGKDREEAKKMRIIEAGFAILSGTSPNAFENIGKGATQGLKGYASDIKDLQKTERELGDATRKMMQAQNQIRMGVATAAGEDYQKAVERYNAANERYGRS